MEKILGCARCGWVARPELFEGAAPTCAHCGEALVRMSLPHARRLVAARRRADERRTAAAKAAEFGLDRTVRRAPGG